MKRSLRNKSNRKHRHKKGKKSLFSSKRRMVGGNVNPASFRPFESSPEQYYYKLNNYMNDPNDPGTTMSARNFPNLVGGRAKGRRNLNTKKKRSRAIKIKGGNPMLPGSTNNALTNFGNYDMPPSAISLVNSSPLPNTDVFDQPAYYTYNADRPPLA